MNDEPMINGYLRQMLSMGGSDLHLSINLPARARIHGNIQNLEEEPITPEKMEYMLREICFPEWRWDEFMNKRDLDFAHEIPGFARFRCNYLYNYHGMGAVLRQIPSKILTIEDLKLPEILKEICTYHSGLVLVTGPTGSGKSTTLAAMIDYINNNTSKHIITIEDPIEFVHQNKNCTIVHREVGVHSRSFPDALRGAMRSDPDIILLGEMRDNETIRLGLTCATMGMLVFATLHTNNAPKTIDRIIDAFPSDEQAQIRTMLASCLKGIVSQLLCRKLSGGRVAVHEILLWTEGLPNTIREGQISNIRTIIDAGGGKGMQSMDNSIQIQYDAGNISAEEAYMKASDKTRFVHQMEAEEEERRLRAQGIDPATVKKKKKLW
ncbi:MAG: PilT/PilU family type 4a pilus ATPase [Lentisphaeria bacterium]|nr:PilT/PilU family type 4a pilus ATPase [Lentisphaeria bacterium]MBO5766134.1 PilT/PilU family type 4a pilus ATPase [Lentisphaeria bacterium]MBO5990873.1 PilT/PilU family type 4a pilus ATPase [Lentisphaeria bacterium]MBO7153375.1 PilT/PilU family type 4a pilus ATPase [Lentisphaeria bacterium]